VDARMGTARLPRLAVVALIALGLLMATALTAPTRADAHQTAGNTRIFVDGELVKQTRDDHFTYTKILSPGCHEIRVVQRTGDTRSVTESTECSVESTKLTVGVDHGSVSVSTTTDF
jgi:uncharacterized protein YdeI (BOF family)